MVHKVLTIKHEEGLSPRPAAAFVHAASGFESQMLIEKGNKKVNAKSIMGVLSLGVGKGDTIHMIITGNDEKEAMQAMQRIVENPEE